MSIQFNSPEYLRLLLSAWINFGAYLNQDGSEDGDVNTLQFHKAHRQEFTKTRKIKSLTTEQMSNIVTIETKNDPDNLLTPRDPTPRDIVYDLQRAEAVSKVHEIPVSLWDLRMMSECERLNAPQRAIFDQHWNRDWSNTANPFPNSQCMISPLDIKCLHHVVCDLRGEKEADFMLTDVIGVNVRRKRDGSIRLSANPNPVIKWKLMVPPPQSEAPVSELVESVLEFLHSPYNSDGSHMAPPDAQWDEETVQRVNLEEIVQELQSINPNLSRTDLRVEGPFIVRSTALRPKVEIKQYHLTSLNWARDRGGRRGHAHCPYSSIAKAFQVYCEQNGSFFNLNWKAHVVSNGM